jgi:transposase
LIGRVISFCFLWVATQQVLAGAYASVNYTEWVFEYSGMGVSRRPRSESERAAYVRQRARVWRYVRRLLWSSLGLWLWREVLWGAEGGLSEGGWDLGSVMAWGPGLSGLAAESVAMAAWRAIDARWSEHVEVDEAVRWHTVDKTQLSGIRRLLALTAWRVVLCVQTTAKLLVYVQADRRMQAWRRCPACGEVAIGWKDQKGYKAVRDYPLGGERVYLMVAQQSYHCRNVACARRSFTAVGDLIKNHGRMTQRFHAHLQEQLVDVDLKTNAQVLDISYRQIRDYEAEVLAAAAQVAWHEEALIKEAAELHIGMDEHSIRKGHKYASLIYEKTCRKLLQMCEGRKKDDLVKMLQEIPEAIGQKIQTVTIDRSKQMLGAVCEVLQHAVVIIDKFHLIRDVGKAAQAIRKKWKREEAQKIETEYRSAVNGLTPAEKRKVKKRKNIYSQIRHHLLRPPAYWKIRRKDSAEVQRSKREGYAQLQQALQQSKELNQAYELLNAFRKLMDNKQLGRATAAVQLEAWYQQAEQSKLRGFVRLAKSFREWNEYILNYFAHRHRYTNAEVEGINNKCKKVQRQGYGVGKFEHYKHRCKRAVNGCFIGLGVAPEKQPRNFRKSQGTAQRRSAAVKTGRKRKKGA